MEQITLELPSNIAQKFKSLSSVDKRYLVSFIEAWLSTQSLDNDVERVERVDTVEKRGQSKLKAKKELLKTLSNIQNEAQQNGLTEDILNEILQER